MSGDQGSEAKAFAPSEKKLREARNKGEIAKSSDAIAAVSITMLTLYLLLAWPLIYGEFARMFDVAGQAALGGGPLHYEAALRETIDAGSKIVVPLFLIGIAATLLGGIISSKGLVFSAHPLKPDLKRIHPGEGFKKIFSLRNLVELLKALCKSLLLLSALGASAWYGLGAVLRIPYCETGCAGEVLVAVAGPLVVLALLLFIFGALVDNSIQKWLFTRDMRMTHSEFKREMKENYGDPLIRGARKDQQRTVASGEAGIASDVLKSRDPTLVIYGGTEVAVALRYVSGETPAPVVVGKGTGPRAVSIIQEAIDSGTSIENDSELAHDLVRRAKIDEYIPDGLFRSVARIHNRAQRG